MTEYSEIEWKQSLVEVRQTNEVKFERLIEKLEDMAKSVDAVRLFVAVMINISTGTPESFSEADYGTASVKGEILAFYLFPFFGLPVEKEITPFLVQECQRILEELFTAQLRVNRLLNVEENGNSIDQIINNARTNALIVRGSAYPQQTAKEIIEIQGKYENWFAKKCGIGPVRAQSILWAIRELMNKKLNELVNASRDHADKFENRWKSVKRKTRRNKSSRDRDLLRFIPSKKVARAFGMAQHIVAYSPDIIPVSKQELTNLDEFPSEKEWSALIKLIGLTTDYRHKMEEPIEVRSKPLFVLPDDCLYLGDISNTFDALWGQFEQVARSNEKFYQKYQRHKANWLETKTKEYLSKVFPSRYIYSNLSYPDPEKEDGGAVAELDHAVKWGPFLILIEVKAKQFRLEAQLGDAGRLRSDLKANIEDAFEQARRAARYIDETEVPVFIESRSNRKLRLDKDNIFRVYLLTISQHHLSGLATQLATLQDLGLFRDSEYPLSISIADLEIVCEFCDGPDVLLHYVEKRLAIQHESIHIGADELDLWGAYLDTRLQAERLWGSRRGDLNFATLSGWSDQFDLWMMFQRGEIKQLPNIELAIPQEIKEMLSELRKRSDEAARWIAFALLDLSDDTLSFIAEGFRKLRQAKLSPGFFRRIVHQEGDIVISITASLDQPPDLLEKRTEIRTVIEKYRRKCKKSIGFGVMVLDKSRPFHNMVWLE
ncbi:MAG: NERD domain-containing protein, partial [Chloroflexi bacterium]|nr:NERD domain-containing protein [Chloroflexota bacterium]